MDHLICVSSTTGSDPQQKGPMSMESSGGKNQTKALSGNERALADVLSEHFCGTYFVRTLEGFIHNLNSPLQILWIRSEQLRQDVQQLQREMQQSASAEVLKIVERMQQRVASLDKGMETLNDSLIFLTKDIVTKSRSELSSVSINEAITDTLFLLKSDMFFKHQVDTELNLNENLPTLQGRHSDFCIIVLHLVRNALESLAGCPSEKRLFVETDMAEEGMTIQVRDTGNGISSDVASKVFDPFFTTKETLDYNGQIQRHAGLGLCHANHLLQSYRGDISFQSTPHETVFRVIIPRS
jgi:C4-dicarboxylate-specific signal transduction histidine kinase